MEYDCRGTDFLLQMYLVSSRTTCDFFICSEPQLNVYELADTNKILADDFFFSLSLYIFGLYPFLLLFVNHMQTSRRWFLISPFCYLQRERGFPCFSAQTGLCWGKRHRTTTRSCKQGQVGWCKWWTLHMPVSPWGSEWLLQPWAMVNLG